MSRPPEIGGFVPAHKPAGMPSAFLVKKLKRILGKHSRVGHTGTLDRFAEGLMLLVVNKSTCFADRFLHADKKYRASFVFGKSTDTHDPTGETIQSIPDDEAAQFVQNNTERIRAWLNGLKGDLMQRPPDYSAIKRDGKRLSDHARYGTAISVDERKVRVYSVEDIKFHKVSVTVDLSVSGGTYIRSIARDMGESLGIPVHLGSLFRTALGVFNLGMELWNPDAKEEPAVLSPESILTWPRIQPDAVSLQKIIHGNTPIIDLPHSPNKPSDAWILDEHSAPVAWIEITGSGYRIRRVFR